MSSRLLAASIVERDIDVALEPLLSVPVGLAMSKQKVTDGHTSILWRRLTRIVNRANPPGGLFCGVGGTMKVFTAALAVWGMFIA